MERFLEGPCTDRKRRECAKNAGEMIGLLCIECKFRNWRPDPYVQQIYRIYRMQLGGFRFENDALPVATWMDVGMLAEMIASRRGIF